MGIRIDIEWNFISPVLGRISGIAKIWDINNTFRGDYEDKLILTCKCIRDRHSVGFSSLDNKGISTSLFELFSVTLKTIIESYYKGVMLENHTFHWIEDSITQENLSFKEWSKTKGYEEGA